MKLPHFSKITFISLSILLVVIILIFGYWTYSHKYSNRQKKGPDPDYVPGEIVIGLMDKATIQELDNFVKENPTVRYKQGYNPSSSFNASLKLYHEWQQKVKDYYKNPLPELNEEITNAKRGLEKIAKKMKNEALIGDYCDIRENYQDFPFIDAVVKEGYYKDDVDKLIKNKYPELELIKYHQVTRGFLLKVPPGEEDTWIEKLMKQSFISYAEKNYKTFLIQ